MPVAHCIVLGLGFLVGWILQSTEHEFLPHSGHFLCWPLAGGDPVDNWSCWAYTLILTGCYIEGLLPLPGTGYLISCLHKSQNHNDWYNFWLAFLLLGWLPFWTLGNKVQQVATDHQPTTKLAFSAGWLPVQFSFSLQLDWTIALQFLIFHELVYLLAFSAGWLPVQHNFSILFDLQIQQYTLCSDPAVPLALLEAWLLVQFDLSSSPGRQPHLWSRGFVVLLAFSAGWLPVFHDLAFQFGLQSGLQTLTCSWCNRLEVPLAFSAGWLPIQQPQSNHFFKQVNERCYKEDRHEILTATLYFVTRVRILAFFLVGWLPTFSPLYILTSTWHWICNHWDTHTAETTELHLLWRVV